MSNRLTHIDQDGNPKMVDISHKANSNRLAIAEGWVLLADTTLSSITQSTIQTGRQKINRQLDLLAYTSAIQGQEVEQKPTEGGP